MRYRVVRRVVQCPCHHPHGVPLLCTPKQNFALNRRTKNILDVLAIMHATCKRTGRRESTNATTQFFFLVDLVITPNWITLTATEL